MKRIQPIFVFTCLIALFHSVCSQEIPKIVEDVPGEVLTAASSKDDYKQDKVARPETPTDEQPGTSSNTTSDEITFDDDEIDDEEPTDDSDDLSESTSDDDTSDEKAETEADDSDDSRADADSETDDTKEDESEEGTSLDKSSDTETEVADIYLNFEDATLSSVVDYLREQRDLTIIPAKGLDAIKVSLTSQEPYTLTRAWNVLLTLLDINGFAAIEVNGVYRIVPLKQAGREPLPTYSLSDGVLPDDLPDTDQIIRYIYLFDNVLASQMQQILSGMLADGSVKINSDLQACIITEKSQNIKSAMKIVRELDVGGLRESIKIIRLNYTDPSAVAKLFQTITGQQKQGQPRLLSMDQKKDRSYFSNRTKIIPDPINSSLILLGNEDNMNRIIAFIRKHIDRPQDTAESRLHVKEIMYADASKLATLLLGIIRPPAGQKTSKSGVVGQYKFFEDVIIAAESSQSGTDSSQASGNRLIIACNKDDWNRLEKFIDQLDRPDPQVAFEVMIVDVTEAQTKELSSQYRTKAGNLGNSACAATKHIAGGFQVGANGDRISLCQENLINVLAGITPERSTVLSLGDPAGKKGIWGVVKAVLGSQTANIISQPFLTVNNGKKSMISVAVNQRVQGQINDPSKAGGARTRDVEPMTALTQLTLLPRINHEGVVNLSVELNISEFQQTGPDEQPRTTDRKVMTMASLGSGEVLVIGGLTSTDRTEEVRKTPILGDIPFIGNLFRSKRRITNKIRVYVFIRPSVIKPIFEGKPDEYTELKMAYAKYNILGVDDYLQTKDPIQRWFFKPRKQSVRQKLSDVAHGRLRLLDDFTQGKNQPNVVDMPRDPFYRTRAEVKRAEKKERRHSKKILAGLKKREGLHKATGSEIPKGMGKLHSFAMSPRT